MPSGVTRIIPTGPCHQALHAGLVVVLVRVKRRPSFHRRAWRLSKRWVVLVVAMFVSGCGGTWL